MQTVTTIGLDIAKSVTSDQSVDWPRSRLHPRSVFAGTGACAPSGGRSEDQISGAATDAPLRGVSGSVSQASLGLLAVAGADAGAVDGSVLQGRWRRRQLGYAYWPTRGLGDDGGAHLRALIVEIAPTLNIGGRSGGGAVGLALGVVLGSDPACLGCEPLFALSGPGSSLPGAFKSLKR
jgi:hypothetical protein